MREGAVSGDYSRYNFDPRRYFTSVLMQQGRVALDSDSGRGGLYLNVVQVGL